jgi:hypothetical protein
MITKSSDPRPTATPTDLLKLDRDACANLAQHWQKQAKEATVRAQTWHESSDAWHESSNEWKEIAQSSDARLRRLRVIAVVAPLITFVCGGLLVWLWLR